MDLIHHDLVLEVVAPLQEAISLIGSQIKLSDHLQNAMGLLASQGKLGDSLGEGSVGQG